MSAIGFALVTLGLASVLLGIWATRLRIRLATLRAGSPSRLLVVRAAGAIMADETASQEARGMAASLLGLAFSPPSLRELETAELLPDAVMRLLEGLLGAHRDRLVALTQHVAILAMLQDREMGPSIRKVIEGQLGVERFLARLREPVGTSASRQRARADVDDAFVSDLAETFARVDHNALTGRIIGRLKTRSGPLAA